MTTEQRRNTDDFVAGATYSKGIAKPDQSTSMPPLPSTLRRPTHTVGRTTDSAVTGGTRADSVARITTCASPCVSTSDPAYFRRIEDRQFLEMCQAYGPHGGFATGDEVARRMRHKYDQPMSVLARWIVRRGVLNLNWRSQILVPVFQFTDADMRVRPVVSDVIAELGDVFDDWEIASWFAKSNAWLHNERPVNVVDVDNEALLHAARADAFVARG
jgi:hypothetical protein